MKNRKIKVVALLLLAFMFASVGYAALTDTLAINGTLEINKSQVEKALDEDIHFDTGNHIPTIEVYRNGTLVDESTLDAVPTAAYDADVDVATFSAKQFKEIGEYVLITYQIIHEGEATNLPAKLTIDVAQGSTSPTYLQPEYEFSTDTAGNDVDTTGLAVGETCMVTIKLELKNIPSDTTTADIVWHITATAG